MRCTRSSRLVRGTSLIEVLVAAVIGSIVAGGTLTAFVTALRIAESPSVNLEAIELVQYTIERQRNHIACDDDWFNSTTCLGASAGMPGSFVDETTAAPMPWGHRTRFSDPPPKREYKAEQVDCTEDGTPDCVQVTARVTAGI